MKSSDSSDNMIEYHRKLSHKFKHGLSIYVCTCTLHDTNNVLDLHRSMILGSLYSSILRGLILSPSLHSLLLTCLSFYLFKTFINR